MQLKSNPEKKAALALPIVVTAMGLCLAGGVLCLCLPHPPGTSPNPGTTPAFGVTTVTNDPQAAQPGKNRKIEFSAETNAVDFIPDPSELGQDKPSLEPDITIRGSQDFRELLGH